MPLAPRVQFRAGDGLAEQLAARADRAVSLGLVAKRDLARYYALLERELTRIRLSEPEASLIVDAYNGTFWEPHTAPLLWADIDDAIRYDGLDQKWGVDGADLFARLRALAPFALLALVDAAERYWVAAGAGDQRSNADLLRAVGLVRSGLRRGEDAPA
jgi:hypothetical protein